jgi:hypothetical protein
LSTARHGLILPADQGFLTFEKVLAEGAACLKPALDRRKISPAHFRNLRAVTDLLGRFRSRLMVLKFMFMKLIFTVGSRLQDAQL